MGSAHISSAAGDRCESIGGVVGRRHHDADDTATTAANAGPRVVVQRLDDLVQSLCTVDVDVVDCDVVPQQSEEVSVFTSEDNSDVISELQFVDDDGISTSSGGRPTATAAALPHSTEEAAGEMAHDQNVEIATVGLVDLDVNLQPYDAVVSSDSLSNTDVVDGGSNSMMCDVDDLLNRLVSDDDHREDSSSSCSPASSVSFQPRRLEDKQLLDDLWLESTLNSVDDWSIDLFPDLV